MDNSRRKPGRPKASQRTAPLVLDADLVFVKIEALLPAATAETLTEYAAWVQHCAGMPLEEAITKTVDFALKEVFRRDRLWRDERRIPEQKGAAAKPASSPTLPPPAGTPRDPRPS
jgi:hypothetical protein